MDEKIRQILSYTFQILLFLFLITLLLQQFYPFEVNSTININWFMVMVIILGALSILFPPKHIKIKKIYNLSWKHYTFIIVLGILGMIIIYLKLKNLGWLSYVISGLGGLMTIILSLLILKEEDKED